jgi:4-amino-4-deoxy-L-arabinose transferase
MPIFATSYSDIQLVLLLLAAITFLSSVYFHIKEKEILSVGFLILTALLVFSFAALLDPFLNMWDERFHALVGKNLMKHPLMPTLYDDPVVNMAYNKWDRYHIWIHKPPLFLWQIALSFKLFGISEFSLRIPDIVLGSVLVFAGYRSGKLLINKRVGYLTGILILSTNYLVELLEGRQGLDHNDFSFMVYVSLSLWSLIEYQCTKKRYWIYLIGIFSGFAILCKWLVGLLVYLGWFLIKMQQKMFRLAQYKDLLNALFITLLIALPWQIYIFVWYPAEAFQAYNLNILHFLTPLDGHKGTFWYHFEQFGSIYGTQAIFLIIPSFYVLYKNSKDKPLVISLLSMVAAVYLFFSFAATRMPSFTTVVAMIIFLALAALVDFLIQHINQYVRNSVLRSIIFALMVIFIMVLRLDIGVFRERHTISNSGSAYMLDLTHNKEVFKSLDLPGNSVLFNVKSHFYIEAMFYTGLPAYNFIPTLDQYRDLKSKGRRIAIFKPTDLPLPSYLLTDPTTIIIKKEIKGTD